MMQVMFMKAHTVGTRTGFPVYGLRKNGSTTKLNLGYAFNHRVPWDDPNTRLYRLLEYINCRTPEDVGRNRLAGSINLNTFGNELTFQAVADPQPCNPFTVATTSSVQSALRAQRTPVNHQMGSPSDRPFHASPTAGFVRGVEDTLYRAQRIGSVSAVSMTAPMVVTSNGHGLVSGQTVRVWDVAGSVEANGLWVVTVIDANNFALKGSMGLVAYTSGGQWALTTRLFEVPGTSNPAYANSLLAKMQNNTTTRSNVFAVWLTVGYFSVDSLGKLGPEVGLADARSTYKRHRMFAIVDRTLNPRWYGTTHTSYVGPDGPYGEVNISGTYYPAIDPRHGSTAVGDPRNVTPSVLYWSILE
jgi:hypothetical protein